MPSSASPDVIRTMSTELFLNFLGIRMDSRKAFTINLITPDNGEQFLSDLEKTMMGAKPLEAQITDGTAKVQGDASILKKLAATMVDFDPRFEIMPGTKLAAPEPTKGDAFEAEAVRSCRNSKRVWRVCDPMSGRIHDIGGGVCYWAEIDYGKPWKMPSSNLRLRAATSVSISLTIINLHNPGKNLWPPNSAASPPTTAGLARRPSARCC